MKSVKCVCSVFFLLLPNHNYNNHVVMENRDSGLLYCVQLWQALLQLYFIPNST